MADGNIAGMREACQKTLDLLMQHGNGKCLCVLTWDEFNDTQKMLRAVLAMPARNCDVGTIEEQLERHRLYCIGLCTMHECGYNLEKHVTETCKKCFAKWAQMPYRNKEE